MPVAYRLINRVSGGICRVRGSAHDGARDRPFSLILKIIHLRAADATSLFNGSDDPAHWNYWKREALAYQSGILDPASGEVGDGLATPRCWGVVERSPTEVWLWLEGIDGVLASEWPLQRYRRAAYHLGRLQGRYLTGHPLPDPAWLTRNWLRAHAARSWRDGHAARPASLAASAHAACVPRSDCRRRPPAVGWRGDERVVRFGYAASLALGYSFMSRWMLALAADGTRHAALEQQFNRPIEDVLERRAAVVRPAFERGDEARGLCVELPRQRP